MEIKHRKRLFAKIAAAKLKSKIIMGVFALTFIGAGILGIVNAVTKNGDPVIISFGEREYRILYGYSEDHDQVWNTPRFTVRTENPMSVHIGTCIQAEKTATAGDGTAHKLSSTAYKTVIQMMLVSDPSYNTAEGIYEAFEASHPNIWQQIANKDIASTLKDQSYQDQAFVFSHAYASKVFKSFFGATYPEQYYAFTYTDPDTGAYVDLTSDINAAVTTVSNWFNENYPNSHENFNLYYTTITNDPTSQAVAWLEPLSSKIRIEKQDQNENLITGQAATAARFSIFQVEPGTGALIFYENNVPLNSDGRTDWIAVDPGFDYCATETTGIEGYEQTDLAVCIGTPITGSASKTITITNTKINKGTIIIKKIDSDTGDINSKLIGTQFGAWKKADPSDDCATTVNTQGNSPAATLTIGADGTASAEVTPGHYCIAETSVPAGYMSSAQILPAEITNEGNTVDLTDRPFENIPIKGGAKITKYRENTNSEPSTPFEGVSFQITSNDDSSFTPITITTDEYGVAKTDTTRTLPYGSYTITEISEPEINGAYQLMDPITFQITTNDQYHDVNNDDIVVNHFNPFPTFSTKAHICNGTATIIPVSTAACIEDSIRDYDNLSTGVEYKLIAQLYAPDNTTVISTVNTQPWTQGTGTPVSSITFSNIATTPYAGQTLKIKTELLMELPGQQWVRVRIHNDDLTIEDESVTISTPNISTTALDAATPNDHVIEHEEDQRIIDRVTCSGLESNKQYTLSGILMNKDTREALLIDGNTITKTQTFTTNATGECEESGQNYVTMVFPAINATSLPGTNIVVFETILDGNTEILSHKEFNSGSQTILVRPRIGTEAVDAYDNNHFVGVGEVTITDTVRYEGLTMGETYLMEGRLVDKATGEVVEQNGASATTTFTVGAEGTEAVDGAVTLEFHINTRELIGKDLVAFERLYVASEYGTEPGIPITTHEEPDDDAQTITVLDPTIKTIAWDKIDNNSEVAESGEVTIVDKVEYTGLAAGTKYILKGLLIDKATGERLGIDGDSATHEFTAEGEDGYEFIEFTIHTDDIQGKTLVVFETLYMEEVTVEDDQSIVEEYELAKHANLEDPAQTIYVKVKTPDTGYASELHQGTTSTGSNTIFIAGAVIATVSLASWFGFRAHRRSKINF